MPLVTTQYTSLLNDFLVPLSKPFPNLVQRHITNNLKKIDQKMDGAWRLLHHRRLCLIRSFVKDKKHAASFHTGLNSLSNGVGSRNHRGSSSSGSNSGTKCLIRTSHNSSKPIYLPSPNNITLLRIVSSPVIGYAVYAGYSGIALTGCVLAGISDWLDGHIARKYNMQTPIGAVLDPVADKVFIGSLTCALMMNGYLPTPMAALIITRDIIILGSAYMMLNNARASNENILENASVFANVQPSLMSKINTSMQFSLLTVSLAHFCLQVPVTELQYIEPFWYLTTVTTLSSGVGYLDGSGISSPTSFEKSPEKKHN